LARSSAGAQAAKSNRARKLDRARDDLDLLQRGLGSRHYPDPDAVSARLRVIATKRRLAGVLRAQVGTDPPPAGPPCRGTSTSTSWTPRQPLTAGTPC
jgi:hypothetical protein